MEDGHITASGLRRCDAISDPDIHSQN